MTTRNSSTPTSARPRTLMSGKVEDRDHVRRYVLTLDGGEVVETTDHEVASVAAEAKRAGRAFEVDLTYREHERPTIAELRLLPAAPPAASVPGGSKVDPPPAAPPSTALATRPDVPEGLITNAGALRDQLARFRDHYNVISPAIQISELAQGYGANLSLIPMDAGVDENGRGTDTYFNKYIHKKANERALNKVGLLRIAQGLGIVWSPDHCRPTHTGRERNLWRWTYYGVYRTHDGGWQPVQGSAELDLRDGSDEIKGWEAGQVKQQRSKGNEICETKAMLRAIRSVGIQQVYTLEQLRKPFLVVRFTFTPDMSDPEIKKLVTERALAGASILFGPSTPLALPAPPAAAEVDAALDAADAAAQGAPPSGELTRAGFAPDAPIRPSTPLAPPSDPFAEPAPTAAAGPRDTTTVVSLKPRTGEGKRGPWRLITATFANGLVASTFDDDAQRRLEEAHAAGWPVRVTTKANENPAYDDAIVSLTVIDPRQPALPGTEDL